MRRTRILATIGPASADPAVMRALLDAGVDAFRLNFSHGDVSTHRQACDAIRAASAASGRSVAVLQDLAGPKIRTGPLDAPLTLAIGDALAIEHGDFTGGPGRISTAFGPLFASVEPGHRLLLDDGRIELEVEAVSAARLSTRVLTGGVLSGRKGINVPGGLLGTGAVTAKDADDLRAGIAMGVDLVALSFVQSPEDVTAARAIAVAAGAPDLPLIAKIERPQAVDRIEEILQVADGLMIARGDLGIETPFARLPAVQKTLVRAARARGVPVILATEVLESMRVSIRPTRAEVTDAAHAVDEGADAIMLAGETAVGLYPVRAVAALDAIIREAEAVRESPAAGSGPVAVPGEPGRALCEAAVTLARSAGAAAIVAVTEGGRTARLLSALRPDATILAATPNDQIAARLALVWGVTAVVTPEATLPVVRDTLMARGLLPSGALVVFVSMDPQLGRDRANYVHVERM